MAGLPPMSTCPYCKQQYPAVGIDRHVAACPDNPANRLWSRSAPCAVARASGNARCALGGDAACAEAGVPSPARTVTARGNGDFMAPEPCDDPAGHTWVDGEVYCEDCGPHPAVYCLTCSEIVDLVWEADPREG